MIMRGMIRIASHVWLVVAILVGMFVGSTLAYYDAYGLEGNSTHPFGPCSPGYDGAEPCLPCPPVEYMETHHGVTQITN
jgi:hypothetical protein